MGLLQGEEDLMCELEGDVEPLLLLCCCCCCCLVPVSIVSELLVEGVLDRHIALSNKV